MRQILPLFFFFFSCLLTFFSRMAPPHSKSPPRKVVEFPLFSDVFAEQWDSPSPQQPRIVNYSLELSLVVNFPLFPRWKSPPPSCFFRICPPFAKRLLLAIPYRKLSFSVILFFRGGLFDRILFRLCEMPFFILAYFPISYSGFFPFAERETSRSQSPFPQSWGDTPRVPLQWIHSRRRQLRTYPSEANNLVPTSVGSFKSHCFPSLKMFVFPYCIGKDPVQRFFPPLLNLDRLPPFEKSSSRDKPLFSFHIEIDASSARLVPCAIGF